MNKIAKIKSYIRDFNRFAEFGLITSFKLVFVSSRMDYYSREAYKKRVIYQYLEREFKNVPLDLSEEGCNKINQTKKIWVMWWQGQESMPPLVKACFNSLIKNAPAGYEIILLTENNWKDYVDIPEFIIDKFYDGNISITHFSDIIRFALLNKYGGVWLDSTILCSKKIPESFFTSSFFGISISETNKYISLGKWSGYAIGAFSGNCLIQFVLDCYNLYWEKYDHIIDYYLMDYIIRIAYERSPFIRSLISENVVFNNSIFFVQNRLNYPVTDEIKEVLNKAIFHKLTWKGLEEGDNTARYLQELYK